MVGQLLKVNETVSADENREFCRKQEIGFKWHHGKCVSDFNSPACF